MRFPLMVSAFALMAGAALAQAPAAPPAASPPKEPPPQVDPVTSIVRIDTNHDGASSREEWVAYGNHDAGFTAIDTNKDGRVTVAELAVFRKKGKPETVAAAETPKFDPAITIKMADANQDGGVTEDEWVAYGNHAGGGFTPVDANHDGKITVEELTAYRNAPRPATTAAK